MVYALVFGGVLGGGDSNKTAYLSGGQPVGRGFKGPMRAAFGAVYSVMSILKVFAMDRYKKYICI